MKAREDVMKQVRRRVRQQLELELVGQLVEVHRRVAGLGQSETGDVGEAEASEGGQFTEQVDLDAAIAEEDLGVAVGVDGEEVVDMAMAFVPAIHAGRLGHCYVHGHDQAGWIGAEDVAQAIVEGEGIDGVRDHARVPHTLVPPEVVELR